MVLWC